MKKHYLTPVVRLYTIPVERLLGEHTQGTSNVPVAPNNTVAGAKESDFEEEEWTSGQVDE